MDFLNKKFIAALDRLREEVASLQKSIDSIRDEYKTQHEDDRNQLPRSVIVQAELQVPEAIERDHGRRDERTHRQQTWLTVGTWLAFVAAAVYAGIATLQFRTAKEGLELTRKSVQDAADNFRLDERAWVGLKGTSAAQVKVGKPIGINFVIRNTGKTIARNFHSKSFIQIADPFKDRLTFELVDKESLTHEGSHGDLFPSDQFTAFKESQNPITAPQLESVRRGELKIVAFGTLWYDDLFATHRWTHFCRFGDQRSIDTIVLSITMPIENPVTARAALARGGWRHRWALGCE
jgi:hypothetical protein